MDRADLKKIIYSDQISCLESFFADRYKHVGKPCSDFTRGQFVRDLGGLDVGLVMCTLVAPL